MIDRGDAEAFQRSVEQLAQALEVTNARLGGGNSTVRIDAGGVGVWAATTACICTLMLTAMACIAGSVWIGSELSELKRVQATQQDYINAIYRDSQSGASK